nr:PREDICTED: T-cell immunoreceptor with Ig and ITIM domains isoform X2 [Macaca fascicularis]
MAFLVAPPMQFVYLLKTLCVFNMVFAKPGFSETVFSHRLSFTVLSAVGYFRWQKRPHLLPVSPLGRSMRWCLFLIWAQGLRQAPLASGMMTGTIETTGNISAKKGGSVILQCHLSSTMAQVTQVNWEQHDHSLLAIRNAELGWHIYPAFKDRVAPGPGLGLTLQSLTMNDTGEYFCTYHTYPDGTYRGRIFLEVLESSVAEHSARFQIPLLGAMAMMLVVICIAVIVVVVLARKKSLRIHSVESGLQRKSTGQEEQIPSAPSPPGSCVQAEAAPAGLCGEQQGDDCAELHDYFNVLSYRSLGSCSFFTETG